MNTGATAIATAAAPTAEVQTLPDAQTFERRYGINGPAQRTCRALFKLLTSVAPDSALVDRVRWLESLMAWVVSRQKTQALFGVEAVTDPRSARLTMLLAILEREPALADRVRATIESVLKEGSLVTLLCSSGLPSRTGFFSELTSRLAAAFLPEPPDDRDLSRPLLHVFAKDDARAWLDAMPSSLTAAMTRVLLSDGARATLEANRANAALIVALRVSALGLSDDVTARADEPESPFLRLPRAVEAGPEAVRECVNACTATCARVRVHLEKFGVSTDLVFRLESMVQGLQRLEALAALSPLAPLSATAPDASPTSRLLCTVLADAERQRGVRELVRTSSRQLARKIVERSGSSGDHYITLTRREWFGMLLSAGGGGVLTAGTAFLKFIIGWMALPVLIAGITNSMNYALSFLLMQALGMTLATKQPSMTAAALARALEEDRRGDGYARVVDLIARTVRSQFAAVLGNLGFVIPAAIGVNLVYRQIKGHGVLDAYAASYVQQSLHPLEGGTIFYAALTGVLLWLASVAAGWLDNWVAYRRLPDALGQHRGLRRIIGARGAGWLGRKLGHAASGFAGCVALGVLLGMVPALASAFGLPLDVRHVTLSTGALTLAVQAVGFDGFVQGGGLWAVGGIAIIGLLNFTVSFACALAVAIRARDIRWKEDLRLVRALFIAVLTTPGRFLFPPRAKETAALPPVTAGE